VLADHFASAEYDVILCGKQAQDTDAGLTGPMLATLLDIPYTTNAVGLDIEDGKWVVTRQGDSGQEIIEMMPPCLITCSNDMNDPRIPSLKGIMAAKRKQIETVELGGNSPAQVLVEGFEDVPGRPPGVVLEGDPDEVAKELSVKLTNEARVL
jgi:electron transfer flavoprotein beta subunit